MASAYISVTGNTTPLNGKLRRFVDRLQDIVDEGRALKATADQAALGDDWAGMQTAFGMDNATDAEDVYNILGSVNTTLTTDTFIAQLLSRLG